MKKYRVILTVDATTTVDVEANSEEEALELALEQAEMPSVCHYCAEKIDIGDIIEAIEAIEQ